MVTSIIIGVALVYIGLGALVFFMQSRLVFMPFRAVDVTPDDVGLPYKPVRFEAEDGVKLLGWFVPAKDARATVLFCHGNAGNISHRLDSLRLFHALRLNTFIFDYRGYGESEGHPSEDGTYRDAAAAWHYLLDQEKIPPDKIVVFGRSLGGAVAAWLASQYTPKALILESSFTSVPDMGAKLYPFLPIRLLARIRYPTLQRLAQVHCPVLVVHSPEDDIVPFSHGQQLFEAANEPKELLKIQGTHNEGFFSSGELYSHGLDLFISKHVAK